MDEFSRNQSVSDPGFQRQILGLKGIDVDNPQMISLEPGPCHLKGKVYRGFKTNQNLSLDMTEPIIIPTVNGVHLMNDLRLFVSLCPTEKERQFW